MGLLVINLVDLAQFLFRLEATQVLLVVVDYLGDSPVVPGNQPLYVFIQVHLHQVVIVIIHSLPSIKLLLLLCLILRLVPILLGLILVEDLYLQSVDGLPA